MLRVTKSNIISKVFLARMLLILVLFTACNETPVPRPRGFFRIDLPEKEYLTFDTNYPFKFEYPAYARIEPRIDPMADPYWLDIVFPAFRGQIHLSYKEVNNNLIEYLEDSRTFVMKHIPKARAIDDSVIIRREDKVYGLLYRIDGMEAASPLQFILTDSSDHFVRGALYFNFAPNNDSLQPIINRLEEDVHHLLSTFKWQ